MSTPPPLEGGYQLWHYYPSLPGAVIMVILFSVLTLMHLTLIVKSGKLFLIPVLVGGIFEVVGYAFRAQAHNHTSSKLAYSIQSVLILLAPILFAASTYMYLGRIILSFTAFGNNNNNVTNTFAEEQTEAPTAAKLSPIPVRFLTKIFVTGDVICFLIQAGGGGMLATSQDVSRVKVGENVILGGLILQIAIFLVFVAVAVVVHRRSRRVGRSARVMTELYAVSALITVRNLVRVIEYGIGSEGYLLTNEWATFVFDGVLMLTVMSITLLWYQINFGTKKWGKASK